MVLNSIGLFISATDTGVGKTFYSMKILKDLLALGYKIEELAYYKPIQCGSDKDYDIVAKDISGIATYCSYDLHYPASPHYSASKEQVEIDLQKIRDDFNKIQSKHKFVIIEGAGGLAVPVNNKADLVSDIIRVLDLPLVLVISPKLGTINHSLLSIEHARHKGLKLLGIIVAELDLDTNVDRTKNAIDTIIKLGHTQIFNIKQLQCTQTII